MSSCIPGGAPEARRRDSMNELYSVCETIIEIKCPENANNICTGWNSKWEVSCRTFDRLIANYSCSNRNFGSNLSPRIRTVCSLRNVQ